MKNLKYILAICLLASTPAFAADIDGTWTGNIDSPGGAIEVKYVLKADKEKLTGTTTGPDGTPVEIADGKIAGTKISFSVSLDFGGMPLILLYKGELAKDQLTLETAFMEMPISMVLKKS